MQRNEPDTPDNIYELVLATRLGDLKLVNKLLEDKQIASNIDFREDWRYGGKTALMYAAFLGHVGIVERLLDKGANVDLKDTFGFTALMLYRVTSQFAVL